MRGLTCKVSAVHDEHGGDHPIIDDGQLTLNFVVRDHRSNRGSRGELCELFCSVSVVLDRLALAPTQRK